MRDALEVRGDVFQHLALVDADPSEFASAAGRADAGRVVDDRLEREMVERPKRARRKTASCIFSFSISSVLA
ncbi:hypothetical protein [Methylocystis parvus]|uniref:Uncharacterized protein n=1 Tax=Methylocystis parvus TaxID=134 RepID=A0A6B8MEB2_9HYPH|nr:hypothetical protein [Methylocystis parvus]QGN00073.1 hypothetical protein F7D14_21050 [Methylocystis parvus]WBK02431.1 hypothetical protein MMG94_21595 [Methylocystis parvus OBBP]